jgi:hypothetical protein
LVSGLANMDADHFSCHLKKKQNSSQKASKVLPKNHTTIKIQNEICFLTGTFEEVLKLKSKMTFQEKKILGEKNCSLLVT